MPGPTIEELYKLYMDKGTSFSEDVFEFMGLEKGPAWEEKYAGYWPEFDPVGIDLGKRERDLDYQKALDVLEASAKATERVYNTETDTISTGLGKEITKSKEVAGGIGLRSGSLASAVESSIEASSNQVKDLGDRFLLQKEEDENTYKTTLVESALDFNKTELDEKKDFYDRVMAQIAKLTETGVIDKPESTWEPPVIPLDAYGRDCEGCAVVSVYDAHGGGTVELCRKGDLPCAEGCCGGAGEYVDV